MRMQPRRSPRSAQSRAVPGPRRPPTSVRPPATHILSSRPAPRRGAWPPAAAPRGLSACSGAAWVLPPRRRAAVPPLCVRSHQVVDIRIAQRALVQQQRAQRLVDNGPQLRQQEWFCAKNLAHFDRNGTYNARACGHHGCQPGLAQHGQNGHPAWRRHTSPPRPPQPRSCCFLAALYAQEEPPGQRCSESPAYRHQAGPKSAISLPAAISLADDVLKLIFYALAHGLSLTGVAECVHAG